MRTEKVHMRKPLPDGRHTTHCWKHNVVAETESEAEVTCKRCLASIKFNKDEAAEWEARREGK